MGIDERAEGVGIAPTGDDVSGMGTGVAMALTTAALLVLGASWLITAARLSAPVYLPDLSGRLRQTVAPAALDEWWQLMLAPVAALLGLGVAAWRFGWRPAAGGAVVALVLGLLLLQVHTPVSG